MKVAAIICEYNPFHNGHAYQIRKTKEITGADYIIAIMSGQFTQRGIPAIFDKYIRAKSCLLNDVDLVIELPTAFATASAEFFAKGAVEIANSLGVVDYLSFGSECDNIDALKKISDLLIAESPQYQSILKQHLENGYSFPKSRSLAIRDVLGPEFETIISKPNNILAIEYLKALTATQSQIKPINIVRTLSEHNSDQIVSEYCSSSAIRNSMQKASDLVDINQLVPQGSFDCIRMSINNGIPPLFLNDFSSFLRYKLIITNRTTLSHYSDVSRELSDKISNSKLYFKDYTSFIDSLKTKEITHSRISRALLHILLEIDFIPDEKNIYATILGFKNASKNLLGEIKKASTIELISKNARYKQILSSNDDALKMFELDILANDVYEAALCIRSGIPSKNLLSKTPIIL